MTNPHTKQTIGQQAPWIGKYRVLPSQDHLLPIRQSNYSVPYSILDEGVLFLFTVFHLR